MSVFGIDRPLTDDPCVYCGGMWETLDHLVPKSKGGKRGDNLVPCCWECNLAKKSHSLVVYLAYGKHRQRWRQVRNRMRKGMRPARVRMRDTSVYRLERFLRGIS